MVRTPFNWQAEPPLPAERPAETRSRMLSIKMRLARPLKWYRLRPEQVVHHSLPANTPCRTPVLQRPTRISVCVFVNQRIKHLAVAVHILLPYYCLRDRQHAKRQTINQLINLITNHEKNVLSRSAVHFRNGGQSKCPEQQRNRY